MIKSNVKAVNLKFEKDISLLFICIDKYSHDIARVPIYDRWGDTIHGSLWDADMGQTPIGLLPLPG